MLKAIGGCAVLLFFGVLAIVVVGVVMSNNSSSMHGSTVSSEEPAPIINPIPVSAMALWRDYKNNEVSADNAYKNKVLRVMGIITSINKDFTDDIYLELMTPNEFENIRATLKKEEEATAAQLVKGERVVVLCKGRGMVVGSPMLDDCSVVSVGNSDAGSPQ